MKMTLRVAGSHLMRSIETSLHSMVLILRSPIWIGVLDVACETACPSGVAYGQLLEATAITLSVMPGALGIVLLLRRWLIEKIFPFHPFSLGPHCQQWRSSEWISRRFCPDS